MVCTMVDEPIKATLCAAEVQRAFGEDTTAATREMPKFAVIYGKLENDNYKCQLITVEKEGNVKVLAVTDFRDRRATACLNGTYIFQQWDQVCICNEDAFY